VQAAGGVHEDHVVAALAGDGERPWTQVQDLLPRLRLEHGHVHPRADLDQLLDGGGALEVAGHEEGVLAAFFEAQGDLARGSGFTRALEAAEEDDRRPPVQAELGPLVAEEGGELVAHHLDHLLGGGQALHHLLPLGALAHPVDERLDHPDMNVGLEEGEADLAQGRLQGLGGDLALALEGAEDVLELVLKTVKHRGEMVARGTDAAALRRLQAGANGVKHRRQRAS
jgi:hypothetical protein